MEFETERLILRKWTESDAADLYIVNDINFRTLMSEVCCGADKRFYLKVQILMSFTINVIKQRKAEMSTMSRSYSKGA